MTFSRERMIHRVYRFARAGSDLKMAVFRPRMRRDGGNMLRLSNGYLRKYPCRISNYIS